LQVARLAGVPADTVRQAQRYFARLDKFNRRDDAQHDLFAMAANSGSDARTAAPESHVASADAIRARLRELEPDALSPRDALAALYELKKLAE
jgi:DNA mismatch repair protein MutS